MPITGRTWTIIKATKESDFQPPNMVTISEPIGIPPSVTVTYQGKEWTGPYDPVCDKAVVEPHESMRWEFVGSGLKDGKFTLYGLCWTTTVPDAMAVWVCDPQGV